MEVPRAVMYPPRQEAPVTITNKQKKTFSKWMKEHNVRKVCPACGLEDGWNLYEGILGGLDLDLKHKKAKPSSFGSFALICKNCSYTMHFAAAPILGRDA